MKVTGQPILIYYVERGVSGQLMAQQRGEVKSRETRGETENTHKLEGNKEKQKFSLFLLYSNCQGQHELYDLGLRDEYEVWI